MGLSLRVYGLGFEISLSLKTSLSKRALQIVEFALTDPGSVPGSNEGPIAPAVAIEPRRVAPTGLYCSEPFLTNHLLADCVQAVHLRVAGVGCTETQKVLYEPLDFTHLGYPEMSGLTIAIGLAMAKERLLGPGLKPCIRPECPTDQSMPVTSEAL